MLTLNLCLCSGSVDKGLDTPSHDSIEVVGLEGLHLLIRDENFSQELLLELQGLRAFLTQKLVTLEAQEDSGISLDMPSVSTTTAIDVLTHIKIVDSIIRKLKRVRIKILNQSQFSYSPVDG